MHTSKASRIFHHKTSGQFSTSHESFSSHEKWLPWKNVKGFLTSMCTLRLLLAHCVCDNECPKWPTHQRSLSTFLKIQTQSLKVPFALKNRSVFTSTGQEYWIRLSHQSSARSKKHMLWSLFIPLSINIIAAAAAAASIFMGFQSDQPQ